MNKKIDKSSVVKIDSTLLNRVEQYINKEENRLKFVNKKQFIDIAISEYLNKEENK